MDVTIKRDGLELRGLLEGTDKLENDTIVIQFHGFQGNIGYEPGKINYDVSHKLNEVGLPTLRFNFPSCGLSDGDYKNMTILGQLLDAMAIIDFARTKMGAKKIYIVGHSQGGVVASMVAAYYRDLIDKVVLLAPAATLKDDALRGECEGSVYDPNHIPLRVEVNGELVSGQYFRTVQLLPIYETAQHYDGEVLIIHGLEDEIIPASAGRKYHDILPNSTLYLMEGEPHSLEGPKVQETLQLIADFLKD
ncbi:MAG: alpha/beta fold hydrolase [Limosilactobacillus sp.]|uniref:alpha/beta hydrolase n=1 Tax=Limosilactobacillus sp. TaxID=2773925 RepID=UPI0026FFD34E|nr:alpha/beta fold hydrolase [Limosilactobacillus sp.]